MKKLIILTLPIALLICLNSCELNQLPNSTIASSEIMKSIDNMERATAGQLYTMKSTTKVRGVSNWQYNMPRAADMIIHAGDDDLVSNSYGDLTNYQCYNTGTRTETNGFMQVIWTGYYRNIGVCNTIINGAPRNTDREKNLVGQNYFLRAHWYMRLLRQFAKPYTHGRDNMGVPLRLDNSNNPIPRATVGAVMDQVIEDLITAEGLMTDLTSSSTRGLPSKQAAQGMLSRAYLWMVDPTALDLAIVDKVILWADKCLSNSMVVLEPTATYFGESTKRPDNRRPGTPVAHYWSNVVKSKETLFGVGTVATDVTMQDRGKMWIVDWKTGAGWGQHSASPYYLSVLYSDPSDLRSNFVEPAYVLNPDGTVQLDGDGKKVIAYTGNFERNSINKFQYGSGGIVFMADILYLRAAEVILNRAEAYAYKTNELKVFENVNLIRNRALATPINSLAEYTAIYPRNPGNPVAPTATPNAATLQDVVYTERQLELAWEFDRSWDVFRVKRNLYRYHDGTHTPKQLIPWNTDQIVKSIPRAELEINPLLIQNPIPVDLPAPTK